uniref:Uncharacterized protein n=1 Tax=Amphimedon queenslandica TaxID=400682 RepID=A0A1X7UME4_AMPQE
MSLMQRAVSVLLYKNGCTKQPLMITLCHAGTIKLIDSLSKEHNITVQLWSQQLLSNLK